jgi:hypothetical protein
MANMHEPSPGAEQPGHSAAGAAPQGAGESLGYETRDANLRAILWLAVSITATVLVAHLLLWVLLRALEGSAARRDPVISPLAETAPLPPEPRLQNTPVRDLAEFRAQEEKLLGSYGWADKEKTKVRIPIARAMELLVERGEPNIEAQATDAGAGESATRGDE